MPHVRSLKFVGGIWLEILTGFVCNPQPLQEQLVAIMFAFHRIRLTRSGGYSHIASLESMSAILMETWMCISSMILN